MSTATTPWYQDWQHAMHGELFNRPAGHDPRNLLRHYESFNDVRLLNESLEPAMPLALAEIGCATGEFYRYVRLRHPAVRYYGFDISETAIRLATQKYPQARFAVTGPEVLLAESLRQAGLSALPEIVYAKDVVHHQTRPFAFMGELLANASQLLVMRLRTRDVGATVLDPEQSCQYHYAGWMPYIVMNLQEVVDAIRRAAPVADIVIHRHHVILGGHANRYLPKACYLKETGTAETAVAVRLRSASPGRVTIEDRTDGAPRYSFGHRLRRTVRDALAGLR